MLCVFLLQLSLVLASCTDFREKIFTNLVRLCPRQYVESDFNRKVNGTPETDSCCTEDFNSSSQVEFASNKTFPGDYGRTCLFPKTGGEFSYQTERSFYMITRPPKDGCLLPEDPAITIRNDFYEPTCNDSEVIPFMKLLPVSSTSNGLIYKNPHCASCHGQYDVTVWQPYASCLQINAFSHNPDECTFQFVYPGDYDDIRHLECSTDKFNACPAADSDHPVQIPSVSDLSVDEVAMACSMTGLSRFAHKYFAKNVFCYICHYNRGVNRFPLGECSDPIVSNPVRNPNARRFIRIIDPGLIQQIEGSTSGDTLGKTICGLDENKKVCHQVLCPLGQVVKVEEHGENIKCQMESTQWVASTFELLLLLQFGDSIDVDDSALEKMLASDQLQNPWKKPWTIVSVFRPVVEYDTSLTSESLRHIYNITNGQELVSFGHVLVKLHYRRSPVAAAAFMRTIEETLSKPWYLQMNGKTHKAKQSFSRYSLVRVTANPGEKESMTFIAPLGQLSQDILLQKRWLYKIVFQQIDHRTIGYLLNKMHVCQQVALAPGNFNVTVFRNEPVALYYHRTGSLLFDGEFSEVNGLNGVSLFRVCVSDTRLESTSNGRRRLCAGVHLPFFLVVFYTCHQLVTQT